MKIFPAIDIRNGKVVRLTYGDYEQETCYEMSPLEAATEFKNCGAEYLHIVDLDGAKDGSPVNAEIIHKIIKSTDMFVQVGGGIRSHDTIKTYINAGVSRIMLGTIAMNNFPFLRDMVKLYGNKISISIDSKDGMVAVDGWKNLTGVDAEEHCLRVGAIGVSTVVFTDISRDGALGGTNLELYERLVENCFVKVIASGGITRLEEIAKLRDMGVEGAIIGKALYSGTLDLKRALAVARGEE